MKTEKQLRNSIGSVLLSKRQSLAADGIKITQEDIHRLVKESVNNILKEGLPSFENIECHRVLNDNFDGNWRSILTANLYDKNGNCVGRLNDLHFVYDVDKNEFEGTW